MKEKSQTCRKAIYSRKSKFTGKGESIENQITLCKEYLQAHGMVGEVSIYEDEGYSGGNIFRPQFSRMMADARAGKIDTVICYRLDRISRNIGDFAGLIDELGALNISFVSIKEQFDTSTPMGKAMMYIASVFSQLERETIAERIRDNMQELAKTGRWLGGVTPTGYASESAEKVTLDGKVRKACHLKTIPDEAALVRLIFSTFLAGGSLTKTETYLMQNDYKTKNNKDFTRFALKNILINPVYMVADADAYRYLTENGVDSFSESGEFDGARGLMVYNRTIQKPGKANQIRPMEEWIVSVGRHEGLIPSAQWIQVQRLLDENKSKAYRYRAGHTNEALLSGLLFCSCGDYMRPKLTERRTADGERVFTYLCAKKEKSRGGKCNSRPLNGNVLDQWVCQAVKSLSEDGSEFRRQLEGNKALFTDSRTQYEHDLERVSRAMDENKDEIQGLVTSLVKVTGTHAEDYIIAQIEELHAKGEQLRGRVTELEELTRQYLLTAEQFDIYRDMLSTFAGTMDAMTVEQKRTAIRTVIRKIVWDGTDIHLYLFGADDDGAGVEFPPFDRMSAHVPAEKGPTGEDSK